MCQQENYQLFPFLQKCYREFLFFVSVLSTPALTALLRGRHSSLTLQSRIGRRRRSELKPGPEEVFLLGPGIGKGNESEGNKWDSE